MRETSGDAPSILALSGLESESSCCLSFYKTDDVSFYKTIDERQEITQTRINVPKTPVAAPHAFMLGSAPRSSSNLYAQ
jgi:hypothetical protein